MTEEMRIREVVVQPVSARREAIGLLAAIAVVVLLMAIRFSFLGGAGDQEALLSCQRPDTVLKGQQPTLYRSLVGVMSEVVDLREKEGKWPDIEKLRNENIPPFDATFMPPALKKYVWSKHGDGAWVDYYGENPSADDVGPASYEGAPFVLRIIDLHSDSHPHPHQGKDGDPKNRFVSQIWTYQSKRPYPGDNPADASWKWIVRPNDPARSEKG